MFPLTGGINASSGGSVSGGGGGSNRLVTAAAAAGQTQGNRHPLSSTATFPKISNTGSQKPEVWVQSLINRFEEQVSLALQY